MHYDLKTQNTSRPGGVIKLRLRHQPGAGANRRLCYHGDGHALLPLPGGVHQSALHARATCGCSGVRKDRHPASRVRRRSLLSLVYQIVNGTCPPIPKERHDVRFAKIVARTLNATIDAAGHRTVLQSDLMQEHLRRTQREVGEGRGRRLRGRRRGQARDVRGAAGWARRRAGGDGGVSGRGSAAGTAATTRRARWRRWRWRGERRGGVDDGAGRGGGGVGDGAGNAPADLSNLTPREAMAERRRRANAERERISERLPRSCRGQGRRPRQVHPRPRERTQAMPENGASGATASRSSAVGTLDGSGSPSGSIRRGGGRRGDRRVRPRGGGYLGSKARGPARARHADGPPRASTSSRADPFPRMTRTSP